MSSALFRRSAGAAARSLTTSAARPLARVSIIGNLGDTPEVTQSASGREFVRYAVASNSGPKENRHTSWFRVTSFIGDSNRREFMLGLKKGDHVFIEGDISIGQYQDSNGQSQRNISILQRSIEVLRRSNAVEQPQE